MKYEATQNDNTKIEHYARYDRILKFIKHKDEFKFNVGDVLIKNIVRRNGDGITVLKPEKVSHTSDANKKYIYFYENAEGIGFIKPVLASGEPGLEVFPMTEFDPDNYKFELDPEYAEHIILSDEGEVYDAAADHKRRKKFREKAYKNNKKICEPMNTVDEQLTFLNNLKVGDQFHTGYDMDSMVETKVEVTKIDLTQPYGAWDQSRWNTTRATDPAYNKHGFRTITMKVIQSKNQYHGVGYTYEWSTTNIGGCFVTFKTPYPLIEDIG